MRKKIAGAGIAVLVLVLAMAPLSGLMELGVKESQTAEDIYEPLLAIHNQIESEKAQEGVPVGDVIELEAAWEIEDTREESIEPLVTAMLNHGDVLGFDYAENTFYCTLGMENEEEWPEIALKARNAADGLEIRLVDDYTYDWCSDAVREGYRYELLAYTDTQYNYFGIVFTGLPIVSFSVEDPALLNDEYIPARAAISAAGHEAVDQLAMAHLRGGGAEHLKEITKKAYRLEFHEIDGRGKDRKKPVSALGMEADTDWLLIGNPSDTTGVRNHLSWDLWNRWNPDADVYGLLGSELVEVFVNDEYMGLFQLMQRYDIEKELARRDGRLNTDYVYRVISSMNVDQARPAQDYREKTGLVIELRHKPEQASVKRAFDLLDDYVKMSQQNEYAVGDEEFIALVEKYVDIEAMMSYYLFHQAMDLSDDNVYNNLYIWMNRDESGKYSMTLSPWDMDFGLTSSSWEEAKEDQSFLNMPIPRRILDLNIGNSREILWRIWNEKRSTVLTDDAIYAWIMDLEEYVNRSGAAMRDSLKWYGEAKPIDLAQMMSNETTHMTQIEYFLTGLWPLPGMEQ